MTVAVEHLRQMDATHGNRFGLVSPLPRRSDLPLNDVGEPRHGRCGPCDLEQAGQLVAPQVPQCVVPTRRGASQFAQGAMISRPQPSQWLFVPAG